MLYKLHMEGFHVFALRAPFIQCCFIHHAFELENNSVYLHTETETRLPLLLLLLFSVPFAHSSRFGCRRYYILLKNCGRIAHCAANCVWFHTQHTRISHTHIAPCNICSACAIPFHHYIFAYGWLIWKGNSVAAARQPGACELRIFW